MVFDNKTGAGGTLGVIELVNAKSDGHTLSQLPISILRIPHNPSLRARYCEC